MFEMSKTPLQQKLMSVSVCAGAGTIEFNYQLFPSGGAELAVQVGRVRKGGRGS
jgi:hypothetical protein